MKTNPVISSGGVLNVVRFGHKGWSVEESAIGSELLIYSKNVDGGSPDTNGSPTNLQVNLGSDVALTSTAVPETSGRGGEMPVDSSRAAVLGRRR